MNRPIDGPSYYRATADPYPDHPRLEGQVDADVCVIGAGYTGLSAALDLAEAGFRVVVLEAERIGWGASGRNGGQICTGFSPGFDTLESQLGKDDARKCFAVAEAAKQLIRERIARHSIDCDLRWGYLNAAPKRSHLEHLRAWQAELAEYGYTDTELLGREALAARLASPRYFGALREGGAGHFHPLAYCLGLARAASEAGARICERSRVVAIDTGSRPAARTGHGVVRTRFLVIAGNAYLGGLVPRLHRRIMPVGSYVIATEPLGEERAKSLIRHGEAVATTYFIVDYFRLSADFRLLFGGRASYSTLEPADLGGYMRPRMLRVFPQLTDVAIDYAWGGLIAITRNRLPDVGRLSPTAYYAHGYSGQGVALAGMCGRLIAEAIRGQAERFDVLARIRHAPFPGGALRTPLLIAAMLFYRLRDALS